MAITKADSGTGRFIPITLEMPVIAALKVSLWS